MSGDAHTTPPESPITRKRRRSYVTRPKVDPFVEAVHKMAAQREEEKRRKKEENAKKRRKNVRPIPPSMETNRSAEKHLDQNQNRLLVAEVDHPKVTSCAPLGLET